MSSTCPSAGIIGPCLTRYTTGQTVGMTFDAEAGFISLLAVVIFLSFVVKNVVRNIRYPPPGGSPFLRTHMDIYFLNLLLFEFLHGLSAAMGVKWLHQGEVICGTFCTVQGAMRNISSTGVALTILIIAIHTFMVIFFRWIPPRSLYIAITVVSLIWSFLLVYISFQLSRQRAPDSPFFAPAPYWCWIGPSHVTERIWGQYLWMWLAAFSSIILYIPLYFCVKGNLRYDPQSRSKIHFSRKVLHGDSLDLTKTQAARVATMDAMCMLYYPVAYTLLVLPVSIVRFLGESWQAHGRKLPFAASLMGTAIFGLSGLVNVLLFMKTRPNVLLFRYTPPSTTAERIQLIKRAHTPSDSTHPTWLQEYSHSGDERSRSPPSADDHLLPPRPAHSRLRPWHDMESAQRPVTR